MKLSTQRTLAEDLAVPDPRQTIDFYGLKNASPRHSARRHGVRDAAEEAASHA